jgi:hypothetical protein
MPRSRNRRKYRKTILQSVKQEIIKLNLQAKTETVEKEIAEITTTGTMETATTETETGFQSVAIAEEPIIMKMTVGSRTKEKEMTTKIGVTTIVTTIDATNQIMSSTHQFNR